MSAVLRFFAASARHGSVLLAVGIFGGVLIPPLAHAFHGFVTPVVVSTMTLMLLRVDIPAALAHLRRPLRLAAIVGFHLLVCPILTFLAVRPLGLDPGIATAAMLAATGSSVLSAPAFARLVGLDPELALLATLVNTLLVPFTAPPMAYLLLGLDLSVSMFGFAERLGLAVGLPVLLAALIRRWAGAARLAAYGPAADGLLVWMIVLFGFGVMDGLWARIAADPVWVAEATIAAFAVNFGLNAATTAAFAWMGRRAAATAGMMSGNRNMALYLAVLPAAADARIALFFALCQFPLFLTPFLLRPLYRRMLRP
jgi:predicted Na+-dependent transporter